MTTLPTLDVSILAGQLAPSSLAMYRRDVEAYLTFAGPGDAALQAATLARWRAHLASATSLSPNTINRMLSSVKRVVKEAAAQKLGVSTDTALEFARVEGVKVKTLKERLKHHARTAISPQDMRRLCEAADTDTLIGLRDCALLHTLASSGMRVSEAVTLRATQIMTREKGHLLRVVGKNDVEPRDVPLSREAYAAITRWLAARPVPSSYIFTSFAGRGGGPTGEPLSAVGAWRMVQRYAEAVGLSHIKPHDFRRFVGTELARRDVRKAQKALGHKRIDTTVRHYVLDELEPGLTDELY